MMPFVNSRLAAVILMLALWGLGRPAAAQTIRDDVKKFVEDELEGDKTQKDKKKDKKKQGDGKKQGGQSSGTGQGGTPPSGGQGGTPPTGGQGGTPPTGSGGTAAAGGAQAGSQVVLTTEAKPKEKLPKRVIGEKFKLDLKVGGGYLGWLPQPYPGVSVEMASYFTWTIFARAKLFKWLNLHKAYYESNNAVSPRPGDLSTAAKVGFYAAKAAWFLASLGFPVAKAWEPVVRYEIRAFKTEAKPKSGNEVCIVPYNQDADVEGCEPTDEKLTITSSIESILAGVYYYPSKDPTAVIHAPGTYAPPIFFGAGYMSYTKPYQVTIGEATLDKYLFTARFRGGGLALGTSLDYGVNNIFLDVIAQVGLGEIQLTRDMSLNELAPDDWLIGYVQGNLDFGARIALWKFAPTLMIVPKATVGGASFFFFKTKHEEGEETKSPTVNWDVLWAFRLFLVLTL
jgi:hypothetical protein